MTVKEDSAIKKEIWGRSKVAAKEDPVLISFHRHTESTPIHRVAFPKGDWGAD